MKKTIYLLSLLLLAVCLSSCATDENLAGYTKDEQQKIKQMMSLFETYGWERITTTSDELLYKEMLKLDYNETKEMLQGLKSFDADSTETNTDIPVPESEAT